MPRHPQRLWSSAKFTTMRRHACGSAPGKKACDDGAVSGCIDPCRPFASRAAFAAEFLRDRRGRPWAPWGYQHLSLESGAERKVHCDGRDVGKTSEIEIAAAWASVMRPNSQMLIATQCENHLFPLMDRIVRVFESNSWKEGQTRLAGMEQGRMKEGQTRLAALACVSPSFLVDVKRTPSWCLRFANGFVLWGRIAGPHGMNF